MALAVIGLIVTVVGFISKIWPAPKTSGEVARDKLKEIHDGETKFDQTGDTSDLGKLP